MKKDNLEHGIECICGKQFESINKMETHITKKRVLDHIEKIAGKKFRNKQEEFEEGKAGMREVTRMEEIEFIPENSKRISKAVIKNMTENFEDYFGD